MTEPRLCYPSHLVELVRTLVSTNDLKGNLSLLSGEIDKDPGRVGRVFRVKHGADEGLWNPALKEYARLVKPFADCGTQDLYTLS